MTEARTLQNAYLLSLIHFILREGFWASDGEMRTCTGFTRDEFEALAGSIAQSKALFVVQDEALAMVKAALNNLAGYPHRLDDALSRLTGLKPGEKSMYGLLWENIRIHLPPSAGSA